MKKQRLQVGIVGCGQISEAHVEQIGYLKEAEVSCVCDREGLMAEQLAQRFSVPQSYDDYSKMLESEALDVVHITTPPATHVELARRAIAAGCHVYVEKPIGLNSQETIDIIAYAEAENKKLTVGYIYMFDPPALTARTMMQQGTLGRAVHLESYYGYNLAGPFGSAILGSPEHWVHQLPGKLFHNNLDHAFNKVVEFFDGEIDVVEAYGAKRREESCGDERDEMLDELRVLIGGERCTANVTFSSHARPAAHRLRIMGTKATVDLDFVSRTVILERGPRLPSAAGRVVPAFSSSASYGWNGLKNVGRFVVADFHYFAGLRTLLERFYRSIIDDGPPPVDYDWMRKVAWIMDEIFAKLPQRSKAL